jgi:hypothetical protein
MMNAHWIEVSVVPFYLIFGDEPNGQKIELIESLFDSNSIETSSQYVYPEEGRIGFCGDLTPFFVFSNEKGVFVWRWIAAESEEAALDYISVITDKFDKWITKFELDFAFEVNGSASMVYLDSKFVFRCMSVTEIKVGDQVISTLCVNEGNFEMICHWIRQA